MNGAVIFLWLLSALFAAVIGLPLIGYVRRRWHQGSLCLHIGRLLLEGVGLYLAARVWKGSFVEGSMVFLLLMIVNRIADALYESGVKRHPQGRV